MLRASDAYRPRPIADISAHCTGDNSEVEEAVDPKLGYVYEEWMGCGPFNGAIGFARSTDGGRTFGRPVALPGTTARGALVFVGDPAITVAPDGTVYAVYMQYDLRGGSYPRVVASFDHGHSFTQVSSLVPRGRKNWGDRPFIAVASDGTVYVTWDYAPRSSTVSTKPPPPGGSSWYSRGDLNVVIQRSTDRGRTWSPIVPIGPGFPASGGASAPLVVEPGGRIDVLYFRFRVANRTTYALKPAYENFTSSADRGATWSTPVRVGPGVGTLATHDWWINGDIAIDSGGNLYATWDTQGRNRGGVGNDVGWLSFSADHGRRWSRPVQVPADRRAVPHIVQVAARSPGSAYVGWLSASDPRGYALYLRVFSIARGWLTQPLRASRRFGEPRVWAGDTFGISSLSPSTVVLSWGSAVPATGNESEIYSTRISQACCRRR